MAGLRCETTPTVDVPNETGIPCADFAKVGADVPNWNQLARKGCFEEMVVVGCDVETKGPVGYAAVLGAGRTHRGDQGCDAVVNVGSVGEFRQGVERAGKVMLGCDLASMVSAVVFTVKFVSQGRKESSPRWQAGADGNTAAQNGHGVAGVQ